MKSLLAVVERRVDDTRPDNGRRFQEITARVDTALDNLTRQVKAMGQEQDDTAHVQVAVG